MLSGDHPLGWTDSAADAPWQNLHSTQTKHTTNKKYTLNKYTTVFCVAARFCQVLSRRHADLRGRLGQDRTRLRGLPGSLRGEDVPWFQNVFFAGKRVVCVALRPSHTSYFGVTLSCCTKVLEALVGRKADPNYETREAYTALNQAATAGQVYTMPPGCTLSATSLSPPSSSCLKSDIQHAGVALPHNGPCTGSFSQVKALECLVDMGAAVQKVGPNPNTRDYRSEEN